MAGTTLMGYKLYPTLNRSSLSRKVGAVLKLNQYVRVTHQNWSFFFENRNRDRDRIEIVTILKIAQKIEESRVKAAD